MFGRRSSGLSGHWKDELAALEEGLAKLEQQRDKEEKAKADKPISIAHVPVRKAPPGKDITVRATITSAKPFSEGKVAFGVDGRFEFAPLKQTGPHRFEATIPATAVKAGMSYYIEAADAEGGKTVWPAKGQAEAVSVIVTDDNAPPELSHKPIASAPAEKPLAVTAEVRDPSGVKWVRLRYRSVTQFEDYRTLPMEPTGRPDEYTATVPGEHVPARWDFMYFFEVMDNAGNSRIYPDFERETPYVVVKLVRDK